MKKILLSLSLIGLFIISNSQQVIELDAQWPLSIDNNGSEVIYSIATGNTEDFVLGGYSTEFGNKDIYLLGVNAGDTVWTRSFPLPYDQVAKTFMYFFVPSKMPAYCVGGVQFNGTDDDGFLFGLTGSLDMNGTVYEHDGGFGDDFFNEIGLIWDGEFVAVGATTNDMGNFDALALRFNDYGGGVDVVDTMIFGGAGDDVFNTVAMNGPEFVFAGYTTTMGDGGKDAYFLKEGGMIEKSVQWEQTYGGAENDAVNDITFNNYEGTYYAAGYTESFGAGGKDMYILKLDMNGDTLWTRVIGGAGEEEAYSIDLVGDPSSMYSYYSISGYTTSYGTGDTNVYVVKIDHAGSLLWEGYIDEPETDIAYDCMVTDCETMFVGTSASYGINNDVFMAGFPIIHTQFELTDVSCFGYNDGQIIAHITGLTDAGEIYWEETTAGSLPGFYDMDTITALTGGEYIIDIYDDNYGDCTFRDSIIVFEPDTMIAEVLSTDVTCTGTEDGTAWVVPTGGVDPYLILWSTGSEDDTIFSLMEDFTYGVTVTDINGCQVINDVMLAKQELAQIFGSVLPTVIGDIPAGMANAELYKINDLGDAEFYTSSGIVMMNIAFPYVEPGDYVLKVDVDESLQPQLLPTYYDNDYSWEEAIMLQAGCDSIFESIEVTMIESEVEFTGTGTFSGTIAMMTTGTKDTGEPVPGAEIFLEQEPEGAPIAVTESDGDGHFVLEGLPEGIEYSLFVDIPGFPLVQTHSNLLVTSTDTLFEDLNFFVDTTDGNEGIYTEDPLSIHGDPVLGDFTIYPNPSTEEINIVGNIPANQVDVRILNMTGQVVSTITSEHPGNMEFRLSISSDHFNGKGIYFIQINTGNNVYLKKIIRQ